MSTENFYVVVGAKVSDFESKMRQVQKTVKDTEKRFSGMRQVGQTMMMGLTLPIAALGAAAVKTGMDLESAFAGVEKTVDATEQELAQLKQGFEDMSRRIPIATTELFRIGEAAGQLGIKKENIIGFSEVIAKLGVTTNMSGDEAATALARLANITQMPQEQFDRLGATVVALGNNLATTEAEIVQMGLRLAGAGEQVGMTEDQILSFAGALSSVGIRAEMGGSAFSRVMLEMQTAAMSGGEDLRLFAQVAGMTADEMAKKFKEDAAGAIVAFIEGLGKLGDSGVDLVPILGKLGLSELQVRDALLRASNAGDLFRESLDLGSKAWEENLALNEEAEKRFKTSSSQFQLLKNKVVLLGGAFGGILTPAILVLLKPVEWLIDRITKMSDAGKILTTILMGIAASAGPLLFVLGKICVILPTLMLGVKNLGIAFHWLRTNPLGMLLTGIALLIAGGAAIIKNWDAIEYYGLQAWGNIKAFVMNAIKNMLIALRSFLGWIPGLRDQLSQSIVAVTVAEGRERTMLQTRSKDYATAVAAKEAAEDAERLKSQQSLSEIPLEESLYIPPDLGIDAGKGITAGSKADTGKGITAEKEKVTTVWTGTVEEARNALDVLRSGYEKQMIYAEMAGDQAGVLRLKQSQLNEELLAQRKVIDSVNTAIEANKKANLEEGETEEDRKKRTAELNAELANEEKILAELEKQIYETNISIEEQAEVLHGLSTEITDAAEKYREDLIAAEEEYKQKVSEINAKLIEDERELTQEYENQLQQRANSLRDFVGLFEAVTDRSVSGAELLQNLRGQVQTFEEWQENIQKLAERGIDQGLLQELREMGPKAAPEIAALLTLTDDELKEYQELWRTKTEDARNEAVIQLERQRQEMEQKLIEIQVTAAEELEKYRIEWEKKNAEIEKDYMTTLKSIEEKALETVGKSSTWGRNLMEEFAKGVKANVHLVTAELENAAMEFEKLMPAHSPAEIGPLSRITVWGQNLVKELVSGISASMPRLQAISRDMAKVMLPSRVDLGSVAGAGGTHNVFHINIQANNYEDFKQKLKRDILRTGHTVQLPFGW
jgi:TP901 family phage tail tape measure protein